MRHCGGHRIAVISDTHNLLRPEVADVIKTCDAVLHGGDISGPDTLAKIQALCGESASASVGGTGNFYAVRGNNDRNWASDIPYAREVRLYGCRFFMTHMKKDIPAEVDAERFAAVRVRDEVPAGTDAVEFPDDVLAVVFDVGLVRK